MKAPEPIKRAAEVKRPQETLTGIGGATLVYGFLTQTGWDPIWAALVGVIIGFVPAAISRAVDELRSR